MTHTHTHMHIHTYTYTNTNAKKANVLGSTNYLKIIQDRMVAEQSVPLHCSEPALIGRRGSSLAGLELREEY